MVETNVEKNQVPTGTTGDAVELDTKAYDTAAAANEEGNKTPAERRGVQMHKDAVEKADKETLEGFKNAEATNTPTQGKTVGVKGGILPNAAAPHAYVENGQQRNSTEETQAAKDIDISELTNGGKGDSPEVKELRETYARYYAQNPSRANDAVEKQSFKRQLERLTNGGKTDAEVAAEKKNK